MKRNFFKPTLTIAMLALMALLIVTALPLASTAAPNLDPQPSESLPTLTTLKSTEATESGAPLSDLSTPSAALVVQSPDTTSPAANAQNVELVGQIGGPTYAVAVQGNYAYVGVGPRLVVLDVSDPANLTAVGQTAVLPDAVHGVYVVGDYSYVADLSGGLRVIDVSNPAAPVELGAYDTPGSAQDVYVAGGYAYVADGDAGLRVIDVSNPTAPVEVGTYSTAGHARGAYVTGGYAYVAASTNLRVVDVSNPAAPVEIGVYSMPGGDAFGVYVAGSYAYVAAYAAGLRVIDVSDPVAPEEVGAHHTPCCAYDVYIVSDYAYVAEGNGLWVIDVSNPAAPMEVGTYGTPGRAQDAHVTGSFAYVAAGDSGLRVISVSNPAVLVEVSAYTVPWEAWGVHVAGTYAYVAAGSSGLRVVDVSNPAAPVEVGACDTPGYARNVHVAGDYAYVADMWGGMRVIDVSDPTTPVEVGSAQQEGLSGYRDVYIAGRYAYVVTGSSLRVIDVSNPAAPVEVESTSASAESVYVAGNYAYTVGGSGLRILDVSNPAAPVEVGVYDTPGSGNGIYVAGDYAYVADGYGGLRVVDVSNPAAPVEVGAYDTSSDNALDVYVAGGYAYVGDEGIELRIVDVSDPTTPHEVGSYNTTPGKPYGIYVASGYAYVANVWGGLLVLRSTGGVRPTPGYIELVGQIGGVTLAVAVQESYAYLGVGPRLVLLDVSDPANPTMTGQSPVFPDIVEGVSVTGGYAHVAAGSSGLRVVDVSNPAAPVEVGFYDTPGHAEDIHVAGAYAYVADQGSGVRVVNVSNPAAPVEVGFYDTLGSAHAVYVVNGYAYVADDWTGLRVISVADPTHPIEVGFFDTSGDARDVQVVGNLAYVAEFDEPFNGSLRVISVADPVHPVELGSIGLSGRVSAIHVVGDYAYVARSSGLSVVSVVDPYHPTLIGYYPTQATPWAVYVVGDHAYMAGSDSGLRVVSISDPTDPVGVGFYHVSGSIRSVDVADSYAYVVDWRGLGVVSVSDPVHSTEVAFYDTFHGEPQDVYVQGDYAYVASYSDAWSDVSLEVVSVSDPTNPTRMGFYETGGNWTQSVHVSRDYAYVADWGGLRIISVADPAHPTEVSFYETPGAAMDVYVVGEYAYVASQWAGLRVISVSDPAHPVEVGFYDTGLARAVYIVGQYAYVADDTGLRVISVADPTQPTEVGYSEPPSGGDWDVAVAGGYAYVTGAYGLRVVDVSIPAAPVEVGTYHVPDSGYGVHVAGGYAYVAGGAGGLFILRFTGGAGPTPVPSSQGSLRLTAASSYTPAQPIAPAVGVDNPTGTATTYTVTLSLLQDGTTLATQSRSVTVPAGGSTTVSDFNFGTWPAGSYRLVAEFWLGTTRLQAQGPVNLQVLISAGQERAISEGTKLEAAAEAEFEEMSNIVADRYEDSLSTATSEAVGLVTGKLVEWLKPVGQASSKFSADDINKAIGHVGGKLTGLAAAQVASGGIAGWAQSTAESAVSPQRQAVHERQAVFNTFVVGKGDFTWITGMGQVIQTYGDAIRNRVEGEIILGVLPPPLTIGPTTLQFEDQTYGFYKLFHRVLGILVVIGAVVILVLAGLAAIGLSIESLGASIAAFVAALPALVLTLSHVKHAIAAGLVILAVVLHLQTEVWVAPSVAHYHDQGLDTLSARIQNATGASFEGLSTSPAVHGREVTVDTHLTNQGATTARPLVETYIYSVDGRVVDILSRQPQIGPGGSKLLRGSLRLFPGSYRAVTAVHTRERIGLSSTTSTFNVPSPRVALNVEMAQTQLSLGDAVHSTIHITNTDTLTNTGDLGILAVANDDLHSKGWLINLGPGESRTLSYEFAPQEAGTYRLRVSATDGSQLLALQDAGYVVGSGAAIALALDVRDVYSPTQAVTLPITATNAGNLPTSTVLSLVTLDRLADLTAVYTDTLPLNVDAGASVATTATALPSAQAQPGLYTTRLFLGDELYTSLDFAVSAEDTLFADIYPDNVFPAVGDAVTLTVQVMNSVYTYTDAMVDVTLWRPDGITQTVTMNPIGTGQYQGSVTVPITGTYLAAVDVSKPNYRAVGNSTFFVAGERSQLLPAVDGRPILGTTQPVTLTVRNEQGTPIVGASLVVSGTLEYLARQTDEAGQAVLQLSPTITVPYQISLEKLGFAQTLMDLPVWVAPDTTPPALFLDAPSITNQTPLTVTGLTEAGAGLTINSQSVAVDAQGRFTTTVALSEGTNTLSAAATDTAGNTATLTRTVTLDTVPPALAVTTPRDGLFSLQEVISATGSTEVGASVIVSGTIAGVDSSSGEFNGWLLLQPGVNTIPVSATDAAGNTTTVTRTVAYSCVFGDFDGNRQVDAADVQLFANRWNQAVEPLYDLDGDGWGTVVDIMQVAVQWGASCTQAQSPPSIELLGQVGGALPTM